MRIIKPLRLSLLTRPYTYLGRHQLGVAVMAMATLEPDPILLPEAELWKTANAALEEDSVLDLGIPKPCAEFLVSGSAWAHGAADPGSCAVRVRVGGLEKSLIVSGDRTWTSGGMSLPGPVQGVPVDWRHTYGGPDVAENPCGIGAERAREGPRAVPNIEPLEGRATREGQAFQPVSFGPVSPVRPRRFKRAGGFELSWLADGFPGLPNSLDPYFFNAATPDQWHVDRASFEPRTEYEIWNMHPQQECLQGRLPGWRARCFFRRSVADDSELPEEVALRHTTAWFFPDQERVLLIFHGTVETRVDDASDIAVMMPALEHVDEPLREWGYYGRVLAQRLPRDSGPLFALRDKDLLPESALRGDGMLDESSMMDKPLLVNQQRRAGRLREDMLARAKAAGHDPSAYGMDGQAPARLTSLDDLPELARRGRRDARLAKVQALKQRRQAQTTLGESFGDAPEARTGMTTLAQSLADQPAGGPPRINKGVQAAALVAMARDSQTRDRKTRDAMRLRAVNDDAAPASGAAATPTMGPEEVQTMLDKGQDGMARLYRLGAHLQSPARAALGGRSVRMRRRVTALMQGSRDLSGLDLTGIDLSGMDLSGARCRGTWLEMADLSGVSLVGADLTEAVLTRAQLQDADMSGAIFKGANLGELIARNVSFERATFMETVLDGAVFADCRFDDATMQQCSAAGLDLTDCRYTRARIQSLNFSRESRFTRVHFDHADLRRVVWLDCELDAVDFSHATLTACGWVQSICVSPISFIHSHLVTCCAVQTDMAGALFSNAWLHECSLRGLDLDGAQFDGARLHTSDLSESSLREANFRGADAGGTLLMECDLTGADMRQSDWIDAILSKSDLRFADLSDANLFRADISQGRLDASTRNARAYTKWTKTLPVADATGDET